MNISNIDKIRLSISSVVFSKLRELNCVPLNLQLGSYYINQLHWLRDDPSVRGYLLELGIPKVHTICSSAAIRKDDTIHIIQ